MQEMQNTFVLLFGTNSSADLQNTFFSFLEIFGGFLAVQRIGEDKEDFAGRNMFLTVAFGLCAAVAPGYTTMDYRYYTFQRPH